MASTYENVGGESRNLLLSSDIDDTEEGLKLKLDDEEQDDGFEEMHGKESSVELEEKESFAASDKSFENGGYDYKGVNGQHDHSDHEEVAGSLDNGSCENGEESANEDETSSTEVEEDEPAITTPFYGKIIVAPEYLNFQLPEEQTKGEDRDMNDSGVRDTDDHVEPVEASDKENESQKMEEKDCLEETANEDGEEEDETTLSEEESDEDEGDGEEEDRMEDEEREVEEDNRHGEESSPQLAQNDDDDDDDDDEQDEGIDNEDVLNKKESNFLEHSDSLRVNVPLSPTPDSTEVDCTECSDDEEENKEDGEKDLGTTRQDSPTGESDEEEEDDEEEEEEEDEEEPCSQELSGGMQDIVSEDVGELESQSRKQDDETEITDEEQIGEREDYLNETVMDQSTEDESGLSATVVGTSEQLETDSDDEKDIAVGFSSEEVGIDVERACSDPEDMTDVGTELDPIAEREDVEGDDGTEDEDNYAVHNNRPVDETESDLAGKVKELGRIFEGGGPLIPKAAPNTDSADGTPVSVRKFKALFEQDRSSVERAREPDRREEIMSPPRGIVRNLRGLFENPQGFESRKG